MKNFNKYIISALTISSLLATSCQDGGSIEEKFGEYIVPDGKKVISINAYPGATSRVAVSEDSDSWNLAWEEGDKMGAWCGDSDLVEFGATDVAADGSSASFDGEVSTEVTSARFIYPYDDSASAVSNSIYDIDLTNQSVIYTNNNKFEALGDVIPMVSSDVVDLSSDDSYDVTMSQVSALVNLMVKFTGVTESDLRLLSVSMSTSSQWSFEVPFMGSINLNEPVTSSDFYDDKDADSKANITVVDSPVIKEDSIIEIPISVLPFEFANGKELLFSFYFKNDAGEISVINSRVGNNSGVAIDLERGEVTNLGVKVTVSKADGAEPMYFDIRFAEATINEVEFSHYSNNAIAGGYIIQESAMYPDEVDAAYVKANLTESYAPENGDTYIESMHSETVYNLKEATEYTIYGYAVDMSGSEQITEATVITTKSQPKIEITIGEITHESIQFSAAFDDDEYESWKVRYEVRKTEYTETTESNVVSYGDYINSNQLYTKAGLDAETEYYVTVVGLIKGSSNQYVKAQEIVTTTAKPIIPTTPIEKQTMTAYNDFKMYSNGANPCIKLYNDDYTVAMDIDAIAVEAPIIPTGTYNYDDEAFNYYGSKIIRNSDDAESKMTDGSTVTISLSADGIYTITGSIITEDGEAEMNNRTMEFEFVGEIPYPISLSSWASSLYYQDEHRIVWEKSTSTQYMEIVVPDGIGESDFGTTISMENGKIESAYIQNYISGVLVDDKQKFEFAELSIDVVEDTSTAGASQLTNIKGVTKEGYAIEFTSYLEFDPADIYIEPTFIDLTGVISASGSGYLDGYYWPTWNTTFIASFSSDYFSELSVKFYEQDVSETTGKTDFPTGTFEYGSGKDYRLYSITAVPSDGSEFDINDYSMKLVSSKSGSEYTIVILFKLDNGAEYNLKYVGEISNYTSTISE